MKATRVILPLLFLLSGCHLKSNDFNEEHLVKQEIETLSIDLMLPSKHTISESSDGVSVNLNPKGRAVRQFSISELQSAIQSDQYDQFFSFENGATLDYSVYEHEGGSGGTEYELKGIFRIADKAFLIVSYDQKEFGESDPTFFFKYLSTVKFVKHLPKAQSNKKER